MFPHLYKESMHLVVNLTDWAASGSTHRRWLVNRNLLWRPRLHRYQRSFPLQCALDKSANLVIARVPVYRAVALEDAARIRINYKDLVITSVE